MPTHLLFTGDTRPTGISFKCKGCPPHPGVPLAQHWSPAKSHPCLHTDCFLSFLPLPLPPLSRMPLPQQPVGSTRPWEQFLQHGMPRGPGGSAGKLARCLGHPRPPPTPTVACGERSVTSGEAGRGMSTHAGSGSFAQLSAQSSDRNLALGHHLHQENTGAQERAITCTGPHQLSAVGGPGLLWGD